MSFEMFSLLEDEVQKSTLKFVIGWIGNALALFFFFSPAIKVWALIKERIQHTEFSYFSLIANIMNCVLWFVYGLKLTTLEIWACNAIGGATSLIYLIVFWFYFNNKHILKFICFSLFTLALIFGIFALFYWQLDDPQYTGKTAMVFNIIMFAAPGQKFVKIKSFYYFS